MLRERSRVMSNDGVESINSVKALLKSTGLFRRPTSNLPTYDTKSGTEWVLFWLRVTGNTPLIGGWIV